MKNIFLILILLSPLVLAEDHNEFTIGCVDSSKNKYQINLDIDEKKFSIKDRERIISEGLIAKINTSKNEINFQLLETNTKEKKMVFKSKNLLGQLVCDV
tara:strand:+ start:110 stop:409 length:300 start_codon:yes stop_codon:yes gene_type:complete